MSLCNACSSAGLKVETERPRSRLTRLPLPLACAISILSLFLFPLGNITLVTVVSLAFFLPVALRILENRRRKVTGTSGLCTFHSWLAEEHRGDFDHYRRARTLFLRVSCPPTEQLERLMLIG